MKLCEVFKTGKHTDSRGNKKDWTIEDLDKIVYQFENVHKDAPICVGHPKSNTPAYGWVDKVKRIGEKLYVSFKNVLPEFKEAHEKGLFKNRSISLDKDLNIRHIAFLGAQAPAIKGLEPFCFEDSEDLQNIEIADFSDIDEEQAKKDKEIEEKEKKRMETIEELQVQLSEKNDEIAKLQKQIAEDELARKTKDFEDFCDTAIAEGHILPKHKESIVNILTACDKVETFNFADDGEKNAVDTVKELVNSLKIMNFEEVATENDAKSQDEPKDFSDSNAQEIAKELQRMQEEENLSLKEAYAKINTPKK